MIFGNGNIIHDNNFLNIRNAIYSKLKSIFIKIVFFAFVFLQIYWLTYKLYINNNNSIYIKRQKKFDDTKKIFDDNLFNYRRELGTTNKNINSLKEDISLYMDKGYSFILNLTSHEYTGNWSQLSIKDDKFFDSKINEGIADLYFNKIKPNNNQNSISILSKTKINPFRIDIVIKEGKYIDKFIRVNFTFFFNHNIIIYSDVQEKIEIRNVNSTIDLYKGKFLSSKSKEPVILGNVTLILMREDYLNSPTFKKRDYSPFNKANILISSLDLNLTLNTKISNNDDYNHVKAYSFIVTFLGLIEIYYCSKLLIKISSNDEIANQLSLITIAINCCLKLVNCVIHFYLSMRITEGELSYQFGIIAIIYFFNFVGFELKLLLLILRIKNEFGGNRNFYRKNMICLYLLIYTSFTFIFFNIGECITNYHLIIIAYIFSWLGQILLSIFKNSRPPMSRLYIVWHSISRLFLPIYAKAFSKNLFDLRPSYLKVAILIIIICVEAIVLILQKGLGPRFIIHKKCRKQNQIFDYYRDKVNIEKHVSQNPLCVICLENLNVEVDENFNKIKKKKKPKTLERKIMNVLYLDVLNRKIKNCIQYLEGAYPKKKYMITPCDHVFHTVCLEKWIKIKNECPYCKNEIPQVD